MFFEITSSKISTHQPVSFETVRDVLEKKFPVDMSENAPTDEYGDFLGTVSTGVAGKSFQLSLPRADSKERDSYEVEYELKKENGTISTVLTIHANDIYTEQETVRSVTDALASIFGGHVSINERDIGFTLTPEYESLYESPSTLAAFFGETEAAIQECEVTRITKEICDDLNGRMKASKLCVLDNSTSEAFNEFVDAMKNEITQVIENSFDKKPAQTNAPSP